MVLRGGGEGRVRWALPRALLLRCMLLSTSFSRALCAHSDSANVVCESTVFCLPCARPGAMSLRLLRRRALAQPASARQPQGQTAAQSAGVLLFACCRLLCAHVLCADLLLRCLGCLPCS